MEKPHCERNRFRHLKNIIVLCKNQRFSEGLLIFSNLAKGFSKFFMDMTEPCFSSGKKNIFKRERRWRTFGGNAKFK